MTTRTRTKTRTALMGSLWRRGNPPTIIGPFSYTEEYGRITDSFGKKKREDGSTPPSDLFLLREKISPLAVQYVAKSAADGIVYDRGTNLPCATRGTGDSWVTAAEWAAIEPTSEALVASLLAKTNPFSYTVSLPVMVVELIEAATLFKLAMNNLFSIIGSQHLNYVFGWAQIIRDVKTLMTITTVIESKVKEFNSLVKQGGLRRSYRLGSYRGSRDDGAYTAWSTHGLTFTANSTTVYSSKIWGSVRWRPARNKQIEVSKLSAFNEAAKIVFDIGVIDVSTIWEAIPFSWLVDYFLNVGDVLLAIENTDLVEPYDICIMRHRETWTINRLIQQTNTNWPWTREYASSGGTVKQDFKLREVRTVSGVSSLLSFGFMSDRQALNLVALLMSLARFRLPGQL